jgi:triosephosphate isomerase
LLERQIRIGLEGVARPTMPEIIIAYEPIWAIGEGAKPAPPEQIAEVHDFIRNLLMDLYGEQVAARVRILYGGNVKPDNINEIMQLAGVDGALVGGASLNASDFSKIIRFGLPD